MMPQSNWPERCTLMGCTLPVAPGHHHHMFRGHLEIAACRCPKGGQPGTRPKEATKA